MSSRLKRDGEEGVWSTAEKRRGHVVQGEEQDHGREAQGRALSPMKGRGSLTHTHGLAGNRDFDDHFGLELLRITNRVDQLHRGLRNVVFVEIDQL